MPEVGDRDDDQQVKNHSDQTDAGQQNVNNCGFRVRAHYLPAGGVDVGKAEFIFFHGLAYQRERGGSTESWQLSDQSSLLAI